MAPNGPFPVLTRSTPDPDRAAYWYTRGRKDALRGEPPFDFVQSAEERSPEDIASAKAHYNQGASSVAPDDKERYAGLLFEIEELENLVQSRDTNDPSRARRLLAEARGSCSRREHPALGD
jgi:hypothetical protein